MSTTCPSAMGFEVSYCLAHTLTRTFFAMLRVEGGLGRRGGLHGGLFFERVEVQVEDGAIHVFYHFGLHAAHGLYDGGGERAELRRAGCGLADLAHFRGHAHR